MQCALYREAVSARLDGEPLGLSAAALDAHLADCADCAGWERAAAAVTRRARLAAAPPVPDLTAAVLGALPAELPGAARAARARLADVALRLALLAVALVQAGLAWPVLVTGPGAMSAPAHVAHETGAWNLAVAAAFLAVALAPRLAGGALPFLGTLAALLTSLALRDLSAGHVPVEREVVHVLVLAGVLLVGAVAWRGRRGSGPGMTALRRLVA